MESHNIKLDAAFGTHTGLMTGNEGFHEEGPPCCKCDIFIQTLEDKLSIVDTSEQELID